MTRQIKRRTLLQREELLYDTSGSPNGGVWTARTARTIFRRFPDSAFTPSSHFPGHRWETSRRMQGEEDRQSITSFPSASPLQRRRRRWAEDRRGNSRCLSRSIPSCASLMASLTASASPYQIGQNQVQIRPSTRDDFRPISDPLCSICSVSDLYHRPGSFRLNQSVVKIDLSCLLFFCDAAET